jgi:hypothetical protein
MATRAALKLADYVVTEAGFGADLGAEKFFDIMCRKAGLKPAAAVIVATVRALKMHGGVAKDALGAENLPALEAGLANLARHIANVRKFGVPGRGRDKPIRERHGDRSSHSSRARSPASSRSRRLCAITGRAASAGAEGSRPCRRGSRGRRGSRVSAPVSPTT